MHYCSGLSLSRRWQAQIWALAQMVEVIGAIFHWIRCSVASSGNPSSIQYTYTGKVRCLLACFEMLYINLPSCALATLITRSSSQTWRTVSSSPHGFESQYGIVKFFSHVHSTRTSLLKLMFSVLPQIKINNYILTPSQSIISLKRLLRTRYHEKNYFNCVLVDILSSRTIILGYPS